MKYSSIRDLLGEAGANSSGDAIKLRTASGTAAISTIDKTGAKAIEEQLISPQFGPERPLKRRLKESVLRLTQPTWEPNFKFSQSSRSCKPIRILIFSRNRTHMLSLSERSPAFSQATTTTKLRFCKTRRRRSRRRLLLQVQF